MQRPARPEYTQKQTFASPSQQQYAAPQQQVRVSQPTAYTAPIARQQVCFINFFTFKFAFFFNYLSFNFSQVNNNNNNTQQDQLLHKMPIHKFLKVVVPVF